MKLLALDTATENCSAALCVGVTVLQRELRLDRGHAGHILQMVDELLTQGGLTLAGLDAIAFGRGPGAFTGVRLAASVTQGLAFGAGLAVVPVSDLRALAQRALETSPAAGRVLVCSDARMSEVYWACFERGPDGLAHEVAAERVGPPELVELPAAWRAGERAVGAGSGFTAYRQALRQAAGELAEVQGDLLPRALEMLRLAAPEVAAGRVVEAGGALPVYLRDQVARPCA
ncbi:MAG: tRNA (adenosine(37)-N6)-threonylcarbamoyltransferase complex dimerization subunit type 1 TsaB [Proteobacteria bacterium]|nr:tRNA (adenosine(37)-N6)-threonylcarbamoyltransferase complex dimerization subunit type 1 TsaB [Pseudomonadota bacterium]